MTGCEISHFCPALCSTTMQLYPLLIGISSMACPGDPDPNSAASEGGIKHVGLRRTKPVQQIHLLCHSEKIVLKQHGFYLSYCALVGNSPFPFLFWLV